MQIKKGLNKLVDRVEKMNIYIIFAIILFVQIVFMLYYCNMKQGFFVDEIWSYGLSNSYYHAQIWEDNGLDNVKIEPEIFKSYLTVNKGEEFSYGSVIYNQTHDAHPPLFYMVLHTISSFFPGKFSKWFGLIPNVIYFAIAMYLLLRVARCISKKNIFNILVLVLYGFSIGAVNSVTYVRMYMLLTVWCLFFLLENIQIYKEEKITVKRFVLLCIATFGGLYTHFFFIIFACPIVGLMLTKVIRERNLGWKVFLKYSIAGGIGIICAFGTFPTYLRKISGKDGNANSSLTHTNMRNFSDWGERIKIYWKDISSELFGSLWSVILILFLVLLVGYRVCNILYKIKIEKKEKKIQLIIEKKPISGKKIIEIKQSYIIAIGILLVIVFYFLLVCKITVFSSNRFMMCIYPLIVLEMSILIWRTITCMTRKKVMQRVVLGLICIFIVGITYFANDPEYIYEEKGGNEQVLQEYTELPVIYIYASQHRILDNALNLMNCKKDIYQIDLDKIKQNIKKVDASEDEMIIYVDTLVNDYGSSVDECLKYVKQELNYNKSELLGTDDMSNIYLLKR